MWPDDAVARAWARSIAAEMHSGFAALRNDMTMCICERRRRARRRCRGSPPTSRASTELWSEGRARFGGGGAFLCGEFSIVDAFFCPVAFRFDSYGVALGRRRGGVSRSAARAPAMREWAAALRRDASASTPTSRASSRRSSSDRVATGDERARRRVAAIACASAAAAKTPLRIIGGGTKDFYGQRLARRALRRRSACRHRRLRSDRARDHRARRHAARRASSGAGRRAARCWLRAAALRRRRDRSAAASRAGLSGSAPPVCGRGARPGAGRARARRHAATICRSAAR